MGKRVLAVLLILLVVVSGVFADSSLLRSSIEACTYQELVEMARSCGLDSSLEEDALREEVLKYYGISDDGQLAEDVQETISDVTSIVIDHADRMDALDDVVVLSGGVRISFSSEQTGQRTLVANTVAIDIASKILQASGDVVLEDESGNSRTFRGQIVSMDWASLDVVVFDGLSTTTRKNSTGAGILFYVSGKEVSYDGQSSGVFFNDGTISTSDKDPYWSITSKKLSLSGNDLFVDRAVFRLGRVPVFYFPVFFYPGTTLSFNPSIGLSSTKGAFMATTYEVYGQYPRLGSVGTKSSSKSNSMDISGLTSFLEEDKENQMVNDGLYYRPLGSDESLSATEQWARETGSYLAVFADVYQNLGLSLGFDTMNRLFDKSLTISSIGLAAYMPEQDFTGMRRFRYNFDFDVDYFKDDLKVKASIPLRSDPAVRSDYLNRNTAFVLDSLLGTYQYFPSTYNSQSTFTWIVDSSFKKSVGNYNFSINSLKADVDYSLVKTLDENALYHYEPNVVEASLPYLNLSSDGVFVDLSGPAKSSTKHIGYSNDLAQSLENEKQGLESDLSAISGDSSSQLPVTTYSAPELNLEQTTTSQAASFKLGYTYNQSLDNVYKQLLTHDNFYTKINSTIYANASAPNQWFRVNETLRPQFNFIKTNISGSDPIQIDEFYLSSALNASIPRFGFSYNLSQRIYVHYSNSSQTSVTDRWGQWDSKDITAHNVQFSKTWSPFTVGFYVQLKPLTEILKPSLSYVHNGFTASADFSMTRPADCEEFKKGTANLNIAYKNDIFSASVANNYDFTKADPDPWAGYSLVQTATIQPIKGLSFSEKASFTDCFVASSLLLAGDYTLDSNVIDLVASSSMKFTGSGFDKDSLNINLKLSQNQVSLWKKRIAFESAMSFSFNYDFQNPFRSYLTAGLSLSFAIAEFLDLSVGVESSNKSFARYYGTDGAFSFSKFFDDLAKSFDFFGDGRRSTGFNLSAFKLQLVHYMRDWNLYIDAQGSLTTQYTGIYEWVPSVTVYVRWNAIPELRTQGTWDASTKEWT